MSHFRVSCGRHFISQWIIIVSLSTPTGRPGSNNHTVGATAYVAAGTARLDIISLDSAVEWYFSQGLAQEKYDAYSMMINWLITYKFSITLVKLKTNDCICDIVSNFYPRWDTKHSYSLIIRSMLQIFPKFFWIGFFEQSKT